MIIEPQAPHTPSAVEQEHIRQALDASQTAIDAISTILTVSTWALAIIAVFLGLVALWGYSAVRRAACDQAKRIANEQFDAYVGTDQFKKLVAERIAKSVEERWGKAVVLTRLEEEPNIAGEPAPFPEKPVKGGEQ